ncbi:MAG: PEGA domain-containing protein [Athalassotoga sp.]
MKKSLFPLILILTFASLAFGIQVTILTVPPQSMVYVNGTLVGQTSLNGTIVVNLNAISNISVQNVGYLPFNFVYDPSSSSTVVVVNLQPLSYISIFTHPSGANVFIDKDLFISPATVTVSPGLHRILIEKNGYLSKTLTVSAVPFQVTKTSVELIPSGKINVNTDPSHAQIFMDGQYAGITPFSTVLNPGTYSLTLKATNFSEISTYVSISQNSTPQTLFFKMKKIVDVTIDSSPSGVFVNLGGIKFNTPKSLKVPSGTYTYTASQVYFQSKSGTLSIFSSGTYTIFLKPMTSLVVFSSNPPGAAVEINGKLLGQTQFSKQMPYGIYNVKMIGDNSKIWFGRVNVDQQVVNVYGDMVNAGMITVNATPSQNTLVHIGSIWSTLPATLNASVGIYPVEFYNPEFPPKTIYVKVNGGSITNIYEYLQPMGTIFVGSTPPASVNLNGKFIGKTPIFDFRLLPGTYQIDISWQDGSLSRVLNVQGDGFYNLYFTDPSFVDVKFISFPDPVKVVLDNGSEGYTPFAVKMSRGIHTYKVYDLFGNQISTGKIDTRFMNPKSYFFIGG